MQSYSENSIKVLCSNFSCVHQLSLETGPKKSEDSNPFEHPVVECYSSQAIRFCEQLVTSFRVPMNGYSFTEYIPGFDNLILVAKSGQESTTFKVFDTSRIKLSKQEMYSQEFEEVFCKKDFEYPFILTNCAWAKSDSLVCLV